MWPVAGVHSLAPLFYVRLSDITSSTSIVLAQLPRGYGTDTDSLKEVRAILSVNVGVFVEGLTGPLPFASPIQTTF